MRIIDQKKTGQLLEKCRLDKGWKTRDVYEKTYISKESLRRYERGDALPTLQNLIILADLYGKSLDEIIVYYKHKVKHKEGE